MGLRVEEAMTRTPKTISSDEMAVEAMQARFYWAHPNGALRVPDAVLPQGRAFSPLGCLGAQNMCDATYGP